jgi:short-subunit dehydrogenase
MAGRTRFDLRGATAVLTGAAGGIGAALARQLAALGANLALVDIDPAGLEATAEAARAGGAAHGVSVSAHVIDLAKREAPAELLAAVESAHPKVNLLINNAGVALGGTFEQVDEADFDWLLAINFHAVVGLTRVFLPLLRQATPAQIVNVSSIFGIIAPPGQTAYCASKFAVRGFSESLRHEFETAGIDIGVTVVHPGGVRTGIAENARAPRGASAADIAAEHTRWRTLLTMTPEDTAARVLGGIAQRERRVLVGSDAVRAAFVQRLFPVGYWKLVARDLARRLERGRPA